MEARLVILFVVFCIIWICSLRDSRLHWHLALANAKILLRFRLIVLNLSLTDNKYGVILMHTIATRWAVIPVIILTLLLFIGGPSHQDSRLFKELWESGHFFLFSGIIYIVCHLHFMSNLSRGWLLFFVVMLSFFFGLITEIVQLFFERNFELKDLANDILGGIFGFSIAQLSNQSKWWKNLLIIISSSILFLLGVRSLIIALIDQQKIQSEYPILADFEHWAELGRWDLASAEINLSQTHVRHGESSLQVLFMPDKFADMSLENLSPDWDEYKFINFSIYNPNQEPLDIHLKIYDQKHRPNGYLYEDRFNQVIIASHGWTDYSIPLDKVRNMPYDREMDMKKIANFTLFMMALKKPVILYVDHIRLTKEVEKSSGEASAE